MKPSFVPDHFSVPTKLSTADFILAKLTPAVVALDYDAVMSSKTSLRQIFSRDDEWPADEMTLEENYSDLEAHADHFDRRVGFTYTILNHQEDHCLGCIYIYPIDEELDDLYDAVIYYWVRDSANAVGLEGRVGQFVHQWVAESWPFDKPAYPGRDIPWDDWEAIQKKRGSL